MVERAQSKRAEPARSSAPPITRAYQDTLQENLLALLCHRDEGREVAQRVDPALFEGDYRIVAERAVAYWKAYDRPPGPHAADLLSDILESKHDRRGNTFRSILIEMLRLADAMNTTFIIKSLGKFIRTQQLQRAVLESARKLQAQREDALPEVEQMWADVLRSSDGGGRLVAKPASALEARKTRWLWKPFLLRGAINLITGEGGVGKTLVALDTAARLSRDKQKATIYLTIEDDPASDLKPRFVAAGGNPDLLLFVGEEDPDAGEFDVVDSLAGKLDQIERIIAERGDVGLVVVDPFVDFSGRTDHYSETDVRRALKPLRALARQHDLAVAIIVHFNKKQDLSASGRTAGSMAFRNVPRSALLVIPDREEPGRILVIQDKFNKVARDADNATAFTTRTKNGSPVIVWEDQLFHAAADDVLGAPVGRPSKQGAAAGLLRELLAGGPVPVAELEAEFAARGISWSTATRVKKNETAIQSFQRDKRWYWEIA